MRATAAVAGMQREVASELPRARADAARASSSGVWIVPAATITRRRAHVDARPAGGSALSTPRDAAALDQHPPHVGAGERPARPPPRARGTYVMPVCCLAEVGQPNAHTPEPTQPLALRRR